MKRFYTEYQELFGMNSKAPIYVHTVSLLPDLQIL